MNTYMIHIFNYICTHIFNVYVSLCDIYIYTYWHFHDFVGRVVVD